MSFIIVATIMFRGFPPAKVTPAYVAPFATMAECQRALASIGDIPPQFVDVRCEGVRR